MQVIPAIAELLLHYNIPLLRLNRTRDCSTLSFVQELLFSPLHSNIPSAILRYSSRFPMPPEEISYSSPLLFHFVTLSFSPAVLQAP